ncbi:hypothetical protein ATANTOWER_025506 [Ataeniobius toweri]|uniref:Uncharacterized protein n=1 Tax=Ataeniobius toweri TaxID=208326 RepID=A0ABU7C3U8_9TELE|nr:hypothetical protein [Ataeniobius toweri]
MRVKNAAQNSPNTNQQSNIYIFPTTGKTGSVLNDNFFRIKNRQKQGLKICKTITGIEPGKRKKNILAPVNMDKFRYRLLFHQHVVFVCAIGILDLYKYVNLL